MILVGMKLGVLVADMLMALRRRAAVTGVCLEVFASCDGRGDSTGAHVNHAKLHVTERKLEVVWFSILHELLVC